MVTKTQSEAQADGGDILLDAAISGSARWRECLTDPPATGGHELQVFKNILIDIQKVESDHGGELGSVRGER